MSLSISLIRPPDIIRLESASWEKLCVCGSLAFPARLSSLRQNNAKLYKFRFSNRPNFLDKKQGFSRLIDFSSTSSSSVTTFVDLFLAIFLVYKLASGPRAEKEATRFNGQTEPEKEICDDIL